MSSPLYIISIDRIMCHLCTKWRRVAWYVDPNSLDECWACSMNHWDSGKASCDVEEDYDSANEDCDESEKYKSFDLDDYLASLPTTTLEACPVGSVKDIYCIRNKVWFKGKILKHLESSETGKPADAVRVHFQGWRDKFDEDINVDSGRIQDIGIFSSASKKTPAAKSLPATKRKKTSNSTKKSDAPSAAKSKKRKKGSVSEMTTAKKKLKSKDSNMAVQVSDSKLYASTVAM